jgi:hypothetical protein
LTHANLTDAGLSRANLSRANLTHANLADADLSRANLSRADLAHADLPDANLDRANLTHANLTDADIDYSSWPLWCGTRNVEVDWEGFKQFVGHINWLKCSDPRAKLIQEFLMPYAREWKHWKERE